MWLINGLLALCGFGLAGGVLLAALAQSEPLALVMGLPIAFLAGLGTYWFVWRPLWRFNCYYQRFTSAGRLNPEPGDATEADEDNTEDVITEPILPGSRQFDEAVQSCTSAIGGQFALRQCRQQEFRRLSNQLRFAVEPQVQGQVELSHGYEVQSENLVLQYGIVTYNAMIREGRRASRSVGVGHLIILALNCDLGRLWIRREGLMDKLGEFVFSQDIDFEQHPRFSSRYLLHADDCDRLERHVPAEFWQAVGEHRRLVCVGRESTLVIGKDGRIDADDAVELVSLGFQVMRSFGLPVGGRGTPDSPRS
jgi:hypothetical protein